MWIVSEISEAHRTKWLSTSAKLTNANGPSTVSVFYMLNNLKCLDIWKACKKGDLDMVRILLREGQDVNE